MEAVRERRLLLSALDAWLLNQVRPYIGQRVLEVGCGHGNLTSFLLDRELIMATDMDSDSVREVRDSFADHNNLVAWVYDITDPAVLALSEHCFDTVMCLNVLEHIADDMAALRHMCDLLVPGGRLILIVPAHQCLYGSIDSSIGHYRRYTRRSLRERLNCAGLDVLELYYTNPLGALGWFVNGRILGRTVPGTGQLGVFNRLVPLLAWLERRVRPPFGISVVSVSTFN
jgi:SAM-dependent methyltransferase